MDDKNQKPKDPFEPESHSAFPKRDKAPAPGGDQPIPSQPRSFSPVRPQKTAAPRKDLAKPTPTESVSAFPAKSATPAASAKPADKPLKDTGKSADVAAAPTPEKSTADKPAESPADKPAAGAAAASVAAPVTAAPSASAAASAPASPSAPSVAPSTAAASSASGSTPPQSSGAGGDTIRLRVQPRPHARTLNTAPGRGLRRRLPDIRQGKAVSSAVRYGPFSMLFGFLWLIFKMVFFTALVLGLGALIGFAAMTEYIKTPEVTVPDVSGMNVEEAFDVLSGKGLGIRRLRMESSALVAPGEIVSQQPPAGSSAKDQTAVAVIISSGRSQYEVPNVVNETRETAENKIRGARLEVGNVLTLEDPSVPRGNVISQSPIGGEGRDEPVKVDLMISAGPPGKSLTMPDLSGRSVLEARAALKAVGIDDVVTEPAEAAPDAKVLSHTPLVGKTVFQTDKVTLMTGKK